MKDDPLQLDYAQTNGLIRMLTDIRFKLLGFVPAVSAAVISVAVERQDHRAAVFVGFFGLIVTFAISLYEMRNTQVYRAAMRRAKRLEKQLTLLAVAEGCEGGLYSERPAPDLKLFGVKVQHDQALALIYGAAIAGWTYLIAYSSLMLVQREALFAFVPATIVFALLQQQFVKGEPEDTTQPSADNNTLPPGEPE